MHMLENNRSSALPKKYPLVTKKQREEDILTLLEAKISLWQIMITNIVGFKNIKTLHFLELHDRELYACGGWFTSVKYTNNIYESVGKQTHIVGWLVRWNEAMMNLNNCISVSSCRLDMVINDLMMVWLIRHISYYSWSPSFQHSSTHSMVTPLHIVSGDKELWNELWCVIVVASFMLI